MKKNLLKLAFLTLPLFGFSQTYFSDDFNDEDVSDWTRYDEDGDGIQWGDLFEIQDSGGNPVTPVSLISRSWQAGEALTPDNWIVSKPIDLTAATGQVYLYWKVQAAAAEWDLEHYSVYVSTQNTLTALEASPVKFSETYDDPADAGTQYSRSLDLSSFAGQTVYIAFRRHDVTDMDFLSIDDVTVKAPPTVAPNCATLTSPANGATNLAYLTNTLSWTAPSAGASVDSYDVYLDKNTNPTTLVGNVPGTSYTATNLDPSSTYYWKVVAKNAAGAATGCTVYSFTTMAPTYCIAGATSVSTIFERISNVTFANINNNSTAVAVGYEDFTSVVGNVTAGSTYTFTASYTGTTYATDQVLVWIDLNNDKDFNDTGEQVLVTPLKKSPWTGSITIPSTATIGATRMRVRLHDSSLGANLTPCGTSTYGQVEDYTLNIGQLAVSDVSKNGIKAYPNPVTDIYNIETQGKIKSVKVYDVTGKQLLTKDVNEAKSKIDFSKFSSGVYVVTMLLEDGTSTSAKVIKK